jgi:Zinc carboxypeptidase
VPMAPVRVADTRTQANGSRRLEAQQRLSLQVAGREGIPLDAGGVLANLTVVGPAAASYATAWPGLTGWPGSSNANAEAAGQDVPVGVVSRLGSGRLYVTSNVASDMVVDVAGWFVGPVSDVPPPSAPDGWALVLPPNGEVLPLADLLPGRTLTGTVTKVALPAAGASGCRPALPSAAFDSTAVPDWAVTWPDDATPFLFGWSAKGRPLFAWTRSGPGAVATRLLVVATIHGDEDEVAPVLELLRTEPVPAGVEMTVVPNLNPDGAAAFRRQNGRGVDLNRNFPVGHGAGCYSPTTYGGPSPFSEPETQSLAALVDVIRPDVVVDFHSNIDMVISTEATEALANRYAAVTGQTVKTGKLEGYQEPWVESLPWRPKALLVELPTYADITPAYARKHVQAVWEVAG